MEKKKIIYLTHWRFPSEKTMTPLIMKTCVGFLGEGYETELWIPKRHNREWEGKDPFTTHGIAPRFPLRRIAALDILRYLGGFGFLVLVISFNITAFFLLLFGNRRTTYLYAHDVRDVLLPCLLGYPVFVEIHDFYESSMTFINRLVFSRASGLIVTNSIKKNYIHEHYGVPEDQMLHQQNAVDYDFFAIAKTREETRRELSLPEKQKIALYTGHLFSWKGVDTLARAAHYVGEDIHIYFVGGTPEDRAVLEELVQKEGLPRITFLPHQSHDRMPLYMRAADVLVLPNTAREAASKYETSPVKLFEYLSSSTPIVASDLPSIRDIVDEQQVMFFEPDTPESLAHAVMAVLSDTEAARVRSVRGSILAKNSSWEARAAAINGLMQRTVGVKKRA
ncbi:MAG: glycosyltransferase [Minisyncoccia bacterium]